jgi:DNA polymerase-3 subunit delta'
MINISQVLIENEYLVNKLTNIYINKSLPHSLIIHGVKGIGKLTFSFFLIKNIYSEIISNNKDHHINLMYNNTHPNIKYLQKEFDDKNNKFKNYIIIDQVRSLDNFIYQSSFDNLPKFVIIDSADDLNLNAANALLKILEEPKYNTYFILITHQISSLLATLRSRCLKFNFEKPSFEGFNKILLFHNDKLKSEEISFLFDLSNGSPGLALELFSEDIKDIYSTLLEILSKKDSLSTKVINLSTCVSTYTNDQFKIYISIIKFILITIIKIKAGCNFSNFFRSNILHSLEKLSSSFDNLICFEILEYINNNENDLFTYNLDKNIFNLNIFTPLNKIT